MALAGRLEDVSAAEILQFLAMSEKSGKLAFTTGTEEGLIVFRGGKIIYAASSTLRETLGSIIISLKMVTEVELAEGLKRQHKTGEDKRLGRVLVEMGVITANQLQDVLQNQVLNVLRELYSWDRGFFMFRNLNLSDQGEVEVDARDLLVEQPLDARKVALDAARQHDEASRERPRSGAERSRSPVLDVADPEERPDAEPTGLHDVIGDLVGPQVTAESVREVFEHAARVFDRAVIFAVHSHGIRGLAQFGLAEQDEPPSQRVRRLWLPIDEPSVISWAITLRSTFRGQPEHNRWNKVLFGVLGGGWPDESVAIPILAHGRVALVFYGDNEPHDLPVGSISQLEERLKGVGKRIETVSRSPAPSVPSSVPDS